ncbi:MAG TPA: M56 family metallopeptidase [Acidobacteriaceae bacterium]|jgi:TonB family protein|nr:M56 family metallopeptidase [Acidobacteriaceae bacterium]
MSGFEGWVLTYLVNSVWQIPLLLGAGWVAARALRPLGPGAEHKVWAGVLLGEALLPATSLLPPAWLRTRLPWAGAEAGGLGHVSVTMGAGTVAGGAHLSLNLWLIAALGYGGVTAWFALRFLWRWTRLSALRRESAVVEPEGEAAEPWARCAERFGVGAIALAASPRIFGPVTMGFFRKTILLPPGMPARVGEAEWSTVMAHEFAHIRRNDFLKNLVYEALTVPVSYHPLVAFTRERVTASREMVCDRMAAEMTGTAQYARSLLRLAAALSGAAPGRVPHALGIFDTKLLERRLMQLTEKRKEVRGMRRWAILGACAVLGAATCGSALALRMDVNGGAGTVDNKAPVQPTGPIAVKSGIMAGQRIGGPMPVYPKAAKKARIQGTVILDVVIGKDGSVTELSVASGPKELRQSAQDAVHDWKYKPFLLNGDPTAVKTTVHVVYSLEK